MVERKVGVPAKLMPPGKTTHAEQTGIATPLTLSPYKATDGHRASHPAFPAQAHETSLLRGTGSSNNSHGTNSHNKNSKNRHCDGTHPEKYLENGVLLRALRMTRQLAALDKQQKRNQIPQLCLSTSAAELSAENTP